MDILRRLRPGSGAQGPVSSTSLTREEGGRRAPRPGISSPEKESSYDSMSWPIALSAETDSKGQSITHEPADPLDTINRKPEAKFFDPYEPDDEAVLSKLFGLQF